MKKNPLNVFYDEHPYCARYILTHPKMWLEPIRSFFIKFRWAYDRATKGYAYCDLWSLDCYYMRLFAASLRAFAKQNVGYPYLQTYNGIKINTFEQWQAMLEDLATLFEKTAEEWYTDEKQARIDYQDAMARLTELMPALWI